MRIACIQMEVNDRSKEENLNHAEELIKRAEGADLILLPEIWNIGYFSFDKYERESESLEGETAQRMSRMARSVEAWLLAGSWVVKGPQGLYNTAFLFDREGGAVTTYRKIHLFGYGSREQEFLKKGNEVVTVETELGVLGLASCYDLRFPELFRKMMIRGVDIFLIVSGWPYPRLEHWMLFNRVRAVENLCFLASANCVGVNQGMRFCGHSAIVDPWGVVMAAGGDEETIVTADIDPEMIARVRGAFPALHDIVFQPQSSSVIA